LQTLDAGGSTAGGQGLALAYALAEQNFRKDAVNRIILMTDGDFNVGISDPEKLKDFVAGKRKTGIYLSVYGFGRGNYKDTMMQSLAQNGNGTASYIDTLDEARKLFRDDLSGSIFPIADDVKIQIEFNPKVVSEYRLIGYETRILNREDFNNDRVDAGDVGSRASVTALYELTMAGEKQSVDPLRYVSDTKFKGGNSSELGYLKLRYKLPGQDSSKLMQTPISVSIASPTLAAAPESTRWAIAVAGFGEKLRGSPWLDDKFGWDDIKALAQGARGSDAYGLRAEFVRLVDDAKDAKHVTE
jgi:Ca-activated chloride channel family protein